MVIMFVHHTCIYQSFYKIMDQFMVSGVFLSSVLMVSLEMNKVQKFPDEWQNVTDCLNINAKGSLEETDKMNVLDIKLLPPLHEQVLSANDLDQLQTIYKQLYPNKDISFLFLLLQMPKSTLWK